MGGALGGGGSTTLFLDLEARHDFGSGWTAALTARRGWTDFSPAIPDRRLCASIWPSSACSAADKLGLRVAQPLRVEHGGFAMLLPTSYDYSTLTATSTSAASR